MKFSIYLHKPIADTLKCYGDLSEITNKILSLGEQGLIILTDKPNVPDRQGATRYDIEVTNESYLSLVKSYPINSCRVSLRRLLYWFVENELYNEFGWKIVNSYVDTDKLKQVKKVDKCLELIERLHNTCPYEDLCNEIVEKLNTLKEVIKNG